MSGKKHAWFSWNQKPPNFCFWGYLWTGIKVILMTNSCDVFTCLCVEVWSDYMGWTLERCKSHFSWGAKNWGFWHCQVEGAVWYKCLVNFCYCLCSRPHNSEICDPRLYYLKHTFVYFVSGYFPQGLPVVRISIHWQYAPFDTTFHSHYIYS